MQIKTIMRYHITPISIAISENKSKTENNKHRQGCGEIGTASFAFLRGMYSGTATVGSRQLLKVWNIVSPYDLVIPLLVYTPNN